MLSSAAKLDCQNLYEPCLLLLQASGCVLQSAAGTSSFALCEDLLPSSAAKLYWTLDTSSSSVLLTGAMEATTTGWLGFGFPAVAGQMQGGNAIIAKPCAICPSGEQFLPIVRAWSAYQVHLTTFHVRRICLSRQLDHRPCEHGLPFRGIVLPIF